MTGTDNDLTLPASPPAEFMPLLAEWFEKEKRPLLWRQDRNAYRIWISEIMLQQTTIGAVTGYFRRFTERLPDVAALAACPDDELMKLWEGLGYYSRARNLKKAAGELVGNGETTLPADYKRLLALPGIGPYTAGAIASMAFHLPYPAVDGNVLRVMARLTGSSADIMKTGTRRFYEKALTKLMEDHPETDPAVINEGLMELGEVICLPHGDVRCRECPLRELCAAFKEMRVAELPVRIIKTKRRIEKKTVLVIRLIEKGGQKVLIRQRPDGGLLSGLYEFPNVPGHLSQEEAVREAAGLAGIDAAGVFETRKLPEARHLFSHIEWQMTGYEMICEAAARSGGGSSRRIKAVTPGEIVSVYAVPEAFKVYKNCLLQTADL